MSDAPHPRTTKTPPARRRQPSAWLYSVLLFGTACSGLSSEDAAGGFSGYGDDGYGTATAGGTDGGYDTGESAGTTSEDVPDVGVEPECDPWLQDCGGGDRCAWVNDEGSWTPVCVPVSATPIGLGDACEVVGGMDECGPGAHCALPDINGIGVCVALCGGDAQMPTCPAESHCSVCPDCPSVCMPTCDPRLPDACPGALTCAPSSKEGPFLCTLDASTADTGDFGDTCEFANECQPGFDCVDGTTVPNCQGDRCCAPYCTLPSGNMPGSSFQECPNGTTCQTWSATGPLEGLETLGVCKLPV